MQYDLEERTAKFGENVIDFVKALRNNAVNHPLVSQVVRSATSIGANYMEANNASSKKRLPKQDIYLQKRSKRNKTLVPYDSESECRSESSLQKILEGGKRINDDFFKDCLLEQITAEDVLQLEIVLKFKI